MDAATISTLAAGLGAAVTAVATIALWRVTATLARETTRMANATGQPQIVATLRPNSWTLLYADIAITNSGNASAFDVRMEFDPPLMIDEDDEQKEARPLPFQRVTILRPGETLSSYAGSIAPLVDKEFWVTTSWLRHPQDTERESLRYTLSMTDVKGTSQLGARNPLVQIAEQVKHIREDWRQVAGGNNRTTVDVFTSADRLEEQRQLEERHRQWSDRREAERVAADAAREATPQPPV